MVKKHLFFDDPEPLSEEMREPKRGNRINDKRAFFHIGGEPYFRFNEIRPTGTIYDTLRLESFLSEKHVTAREISIVLKQENYFMPYRDDSFFEKNPQASCSIFSMYQIMNIGFINNPLRKENLSGSKKKEEEGDGLSPAGRILGKMFVDNDLVEHFICNGGIGKTNNSSSLKDDRIEKALEDYNEYYEVYKDNLWALKESSDRRHSWSLIQYIRMAYLIVDDGPEKKLRGIAMKPDTTALRKISLIHDIYTTQADASKRYRGFIENYEELRVKMQADFKLVISTCLSSDKYALPDFDPLQEKPSQLTPWQWHYWLYTLSWKTKKNPLK